MVFRVLLADGGSYFSVGNAINVTGSGTVLGTTSLAAGIAAMQIQRDADGHDLDIRLRTLFVPPD